MGLAGCLFMLTPFALLWLFQRFVAESRQTAVFDPREHELRLCLVMPSVVGCLTSK